MHHVRLTLHRLFAALVASLCVAVAAQAADRTRLQDFLEVTGFDVALESIKLSAESAPQMLGADAQDFGFQWTALTEQVFDKKIMHGLALDILGETLSDDLLNHAAAFYETDLGKRLVAVENASHLTQDDGLKSESGEDIVAGLLRIGSPRLEILKRMNQASDSAGTAVRAIQEVQVRFLMAAAAAGVVELRMDEADLREAFRADEGEMRRSLQVSALSGAAYTYQAFSDAEVEAYTQALEHPDMRKVYDLMNAVQYEIMANRFEALAARMKGLQPSQEL
ncbi:DUF2059 domain-containing protein [Ascidiaceihabitans sp.]|uniref:DUF2059 domain-containing protein n=1 Tax=Ascidiaceihabitans sp. TaxID=1872644 RepID=UPI00329900A2